MTFCNLDLLLIHGLAERLPSSPAELQHRTLHFRPKIHGGVPSTNKSGTIFNSHGRCGRKCILMLVGRARNDRHTDFATCMHRDRNACISTRNSTRNHDYRVEMSSRARATSGSRNFCISNRKAAHTHQFLNDIHC